MANAQAIKNLVKKRGTIKAKITSYKTFLKDFQEGQPIEAVRIRMRLDKLKEGIAPLENICDQLDELDEENDHTGERVSIIEQAIDVMSETEVLLAAVNPLPTTPITIGSEDGNVMNNRTSRGPKLPEASLPKFDGKYEEWLGFKDAFLTLIGDRRDISNVEKLQYLKSSLSGDAARKINIFTITADNYTRAWDLLERSYQTKKRIIARHLSLLIGLPMQEKQTAAGLTRLADETQQHVLSLKSLNVDVGEPIIVQLLVEKLDKITQQKWDESTGRDDFPDLKTLIDFLYETASRISAWESQSREQSNSSASKGKFGKTAKSIKTFTTTAETRCSVCTEEAHPLYKCSKFRGLPVQSRIKIVKDASLCLNCLRSHKSKECKFRNCLKCSEKHNTLLHQESASASSLTQN